MTDELDAAAQPRCPHDGTLMRDVPGGWECPACLQPLAEAHAQRPTVADEVPGIHGG